MFELIKLKKEFEKAGYETHWKAWKEFSISLYGNNFADAWRSINNELMYSLAAKPIEPYERKALEIAKKRNFKIDGAE